MEKSVFRRFGEALAVMRTKTGLRLIGMYFAAAGIMFMPLRSPLLWAAFVLQIFIIFVMSAVFAGFCGSCLKTVRGGEPCAADLFEAFKDVETLKRVIGGCAFMTLMIMLWSYIPCIVAIYVSAIITNIVADAVGAREPFFTVEAVIFVVLAVAAIVVMMVKTVEYAFTPYILISRPEIRATRAVKESKRLTKGHRGKIFAAVLLPIVCWYLICFACWYLIYIACWYLISFVVIGVPLLRLLAAVLCSVIALAFLPVIQVFYQLVTAGIYNDVYQASLSGQDNI